MSIVNGVQFGNDSLNGGCICILKEVKLASLVERSGEETLRFGEEGEGLGEKWGQLFDIDRAVVVRAVGVFIAVEKGALIALVASALEVELADWLEARLGIRSVLVALFGSFLLACHDNQLLQWRDGQRARCFFRG